MSIDGGPAEPLPVLRAIASGRHRVRISASGYFPFDAAPDVLEKQTRVDEVELKPRPAIVRVRSRDGDQVSVDGRPVGTTPLVRPLEVASGQHLVAVTRRGHRPWVRDLSLARGQALELEPELEPTGQRRLSYVVLGAAGALTAGAGIAFGLSLAAGSEASDLDDRRRAQGLTRDELADYQDAVARRDARLRTTWILLGSGAVVAASGALLYFADNPRPEAADAPARIQVSGGAGSVGLALGGRF